MRSESTAAFREVVHASLKTKIETRIEIHQAAIEQLIGLLDELSEDPDLEEGADAEAEVDVDANAFRWAGDSNTSKPLSRQP